MLTVENGKVTNRAAQNGRAPVEGTTTQPDAQTLAAMRSALYSLAYAAPEMRMAVLWEKLVGPLVERLAAAEKENARLNSENEALAAWAAGKAMDDDSHWLRQNSVGGFHSEGKAR